MHRANRHIDINVPPENVFNCLVDSTRQHKWYRPFPRLNPTSGSILGVGSKSKLVSSPPLPGALGDLLYGTRRRLPSQRKLPHCSPGTQFAFSTTQIQQLNRLVSVSVEPTESGPRITVEVDHHAPGGSGSLFRYCYAISIL